MTFEEACTAFRRRRYHAFGRAADSVITHAGHGLSDVQVELLSRSIAASGESLGLPVNLGSFVDVPSSGGPASLTTLLCPLLLASYGFHVPKLSATGSIAGGIDTLAMISGYRTDLAGRDFINVLRRSRFAHAEPSRNFCPADKILIQRRRARKMMANPELATASLLAKKLATPNTQAVFDFRVGPAGNMGSNLAMARRAKRLFLRIAKRLGINVDIVLTENRKFPSSALGRIESLQLLWQIVSNRRLLSIDDAHVALCLEISTRACVLVDRKRKHGETRRELKSLLRRGVVKDIFLTHVCAQGGSLGALTGLLEIQNQRDFIMVPAPTRGYWCSPDINRAKGWLKFEQQRAQRLSKHPAATWERQVGFKLCRTPGDRVTVSDTVIEISLPRGLQVKVPRWLKGVTSRAPSAKVPQLLE